MSIVILIGRIPAPAYLWSQELHARKLDNFYVRTPQSAKLGRISWRKAKRGNISFEELAGRIDTAVSDPYEESFEHLSHIPPNPAMPSAAALATLRHYAERRRMYASACPEDLPRANPNRFAMPSKWQSNQGN